MIADWPIIDLYTDSEAIADGVLVAITNVDRVSNNSGLFDKLEAAFEGDRVGAFLRFLRIILRYQDKVVPGERMELLLGFRGTSQLETVILVLNELGGITIMRPQDR